MDTKYFPKKSYFISFMAVSKFIASLIEKAGKAQNHDLEMDSDGCEANTAL